MKTRITALLLCLALLALLLPAAYAEQTCSYPLIENEEIFDYGHLYINVSADDFLNVFRHGDIVTAAVGNYAVDAPVCTSYDDVERGKPLIRAVPGKKYVTLAINYGQIGVEAGILKKTENGLEPAVPDVTAFSVSFTMKEPEGYLAEWQIAHMERTNERADYPQLSDAEFANFRVVPFRVLRKNVLYRASSPINDSLGRNTYVDAAAKEAGIRTFINLSETEEEAKAMPAYAGSYYAAQTVYYCKLSNNFASPDFLSEIPDILRFILHSETPCLVHCVEGKDRTGILVSLLGCLCGEPIENIFADYLTTYQNYFGVEPDSDQAKRILNNTQIDVLQSILGVDDLFAEDADIPAKTEALLLKYGMTAGEIAELREHLCGREEPTYVDVSEADWFYSAARFAAPILPCVTENRFAPLASVTAGDACEAFYRLLRNGNSATDDTGAGEWALQKGLLPVGMMLDAPLTRERLFAMVGHFLTASGQLPDGREDGLSVFTDAEAVSEGCRKAVNALYAAGLIAGYADGTLRPGVNATRAETAVFLQRIAEYLKIQIG